MLEFFKPKKMEESSNRRAGINGLPRSTFADDFFATNPFDTFDMHRPPSQTGFPRRFTERSSRFFDDDLDRFFGDAFSAGNAARPSMNDEQAFSSFRSPLSGRRPFSPPTSNQHQQNGGMEGRPIHIQRQQTAPQQQQRSPTLERKEASTPTAGFQHHRSKSHYDNVNDGGAHQQQQPSWHPNETIDSQLPSRFRQFPSQQQPQQQEHVININRQESPKVAPRNASRQFVEINNAQPNYSNGELNPDKRRRFSNARPATTDHNYVKNMMSRSIPDITIEDYGDGRRMPTDDGESKEVEDKVNPLPAVIPLPAPAIPLPPPPKGIVMTTEGAKLEEAKNESGHEGTTENVGGGIVEKKIDEAGNNNVKMATKDKELEDGEMVQQQRQWSSSANGNAANGGICGNFVPLTDTGEHLIRLLDETERQVELLRDTASRLELEKETILDTIKNIKLSSSLLKLTNDDRDELVLNADRVLTRCRAVDVYVNTPRDEHQSRALEQVNQVIKSVVDRMQEDLVSAKAKIQGFLNACNPDEIGHIDEKFQSLIIACTADDQKKIRRRLAQFIEKIERSQELSGV